MLLTVQWGKICRDAWAKYIIYIKLKQVCFYLYSFPDNQSHSVVQSGNRFIWKKTYRIQSFPSAGCHFCSLSCVVLGSVNSALLFIGSKNPNPPLSETLGNGYSWNGVRLHLCLNISGQCTTATTENKEEKWCIEKIKLSGTNWWNIVFYSYVYGIGVCIYIYNIVNFISKYTRYFKSIIFFFYFKSGVFCDVLLIFEVPRPMISVSISCTYYA